MMKEERYINEIAAAYEQFDAEVKAATQRRDAACDDARKHYAEDKP